MTQGTMLLPQATASAPSAMIQPSNKLPALPDLARTKALLGIELEVLALKTDRFGWQQGRNTAAHDRLMSDWMDALIGFPIEQVQAACREWILDNPRRMPNEGDIIALIKKGTEVASSGDALITQAQHTMAEHIKSGKYQFCRMISAEKGRQLIAKGLVTEAECKAVGIL